MKFLICVLLAVVSVRKITAAAEPLSAEAAAFAQASSYNQEQHDHQHVFDTPNSHYQPGHRAAPHYYQNSEYGGETSTLYAVPGPIPRHQINKHPKRVTINGYQGFEQGASSDAYAQAFAHTGVDSNRESEFHFPAEDHIANIHHIAGQNQRATKLYRYPEQRDLGSKDVTDYIQNERVPDAYNSPGHVAQTLYARGYGHTGSRDTSLRELHDYAENEEISNAFNFPVQDHIAQAQYAPRYGDAEHRVFHLPEHDETVSTQAFARSNTDLYPIKTYPPTNAFHIPGQEPGQSELVQDTLPPPQSDLLSNRRIIHIPVHSDAVKVKVIHVPDLSDTANILKIIEQSRLIPSQLLTPASDKEQPVYTETIISGEFLPITDVEPSHSSPAISVQPDESSSDTVAHPSDSSLVTSPQLGDLPPVLATQPTHSSSVIPAQPNESAPANAAHPPGALSVNPGQLDAIPSVIATQPSHSTPVIPAQPDKYSSIVNSHPDDLLSVITEQLGDLLPLLAAQPIHSSSVNPAQPNESAPVNTAHSGDSLIVNPSPLGDIPSGIATQPTHSFPVVPAQPDKHSSIVNSHLGDLLSVNTDHLEDLASVIFAEPTDSSSSIPAQPSETAPVIVAHPSDSSSVLPAKLSDLSPTVAPKPSHSSPDIPVQPNESLPVIIAHPGDTPSDNNQPNDYSSLNPAQLGDLSPIVATQPSHSSPDIPVQTNESSPGITAHPDDFSPVNTQSIDSLSDEPCESSSNTALPVDDFAQSTESSVTSDGFDDLFLLDITSDPSLSKSESATDFPLLTPDQSSDSVTDDFSDVPSGLGDASLLIPDTNNIPVPGSPLFGSPTSNTIELPSLVKPIDLLLSIAYNWYQGHIGKLFEQPAADIIVQSTILPLVSSDVSDDNCTTTAPVAL